jgi:hypothetical protein
MIALEHLLSASDIKAEVEKNGPELRARLQLPPIAQLGFVVGSLETVFPLLQRHGIPEVYVLEGSPVFWRERGADRKVTGRIGLTAHAGYELEFIEPARGTDFYAPPVEPTGSIVLHHLGLRCHDVDTWARSLESEGMNCLVRGKLEMGPLEAEFAYMDTAGKAGVIVEFIEWRLFGRTFAPSPDHWHGETLDKILRRGAGPV